MRDFGHVTSVHVHGIDTSPSLTRMILLVLLVSHMIDIDHMTRCHMIL